MPDTGTPSGVPEALYHRVSSMAVRARASSSYLAVSTEKGGSVTVTGAGAPPRATSTAYTPRSMPMMPAGAAYSETCSSVDPGMPDAVPR